MKIIVDGFIFYTQRSGGISRFFGELLPHICSFDENINFQILLNKKNIQPLPIHENISYLRTYEIEPYLRPWRFWKPRMDHVKGYYNYLKIGDSRDLIWHSTYYTLPRNWKGVKVVTVYDLIYEIYKNSFFPSTYDDKIRESIRESVTNSDKVIAISNTTKQDLQNIYGIASEKIKVIHLACSENFMVVPCQNYFEKPFILYVGNRSLYKNFKVLLDSYSHWIHNNEVDLVAVGSDWSQEEFKYISDMNLTEKVHIKQHADDITLRNLYNIALVFVYPSLYEGFGIPLLEAMACGCPIIASRIPSTIEVAGDIPLYHEPGNTENLLTNLEQIYWESRPSERVIRGLEHVKQYSWNFTAQQVSQFYRGIH